MRRDGLSILKACLYIFYLKWVFGSHFTWNSAVTDPNVWCCIRLFLCTLASWNIEVFVHSNSVSSVVIFFNQATPSLVSSPGQSLLSFPSPSLSARRNHFSPRSQSSQKPSNVQLVPACVASGNIHNAISRHLDKNRRKHRWTIFSMNKTQESKQRSTNWRRRHFGDMQQQPRRWQGFD